jgi:hypothetical protein
MLLRSSVRIVAFAAMSLLAASTPAHSQTTASTNSGNSDDNPSRQQGFREVSLQLKGAVGNAAGKSDQSGVTTIANVDPQPSGGVLPGGGDAGSPPSGGGGFAGGTPPISGGGSRDGGGGGGRGGRGSGNGSGLGGPPSANTIPCGTPQWQCFTTPGGSTYFGVPATSFQGILPFTPAGPWIPTGPVTRLNPVAKAHDLVNHMAWPNITIGINPNPGVVAIKSWFWIQNYAGQVLTNSGTISETHQECRTVSFPGANPGDPPGRGLECHDVTNTMTVDARVGPANYQWTFGDGRAGSQLDYPNPAGLGRAYTDPHTASPVAWSYEFSSLGHPDGFPVSVAISFMSEFRANGGPWAGLDPVTQTYTGNHIVEQVQPLRVASGPQGQP